MSEVYTYRYLKSKKHYIVTLLDGSKILAIEKDRKDAERAVFNLNRAVAKGEFYQREISEKQSVTDTATQQESHALLIMAVSLAGSNRILERQLKLPTSSVAFYVKRGTGMPLKHRKKILDYVESK